MSHRTPDVEPDPTARSDLFTLTFWLATIARMVRGAAVGGTAVIGSQAVDTVNSVPWYGFLSACAIGAIMSLLASLANITIPNDAVAQARGLLTRRDE